MKQAGVQLMSELLMFAWDYRTDPDVGEQQWCSLPSLYDCSVVNDDGWNWGSQELTNPKFRILQWPHADPAEVEVLLSNLIPKVDSSTPPNNMTLWQYRGYHLKIDDPLFSTIVGFTGYWQDATRASPYFIIPASFTTTVAFLTVARPDIPDPSYTPTSNVVVG